MLKASSGLRVHRLEESGAVEYSTNRHRVLEHAFGTQIHSMAC